MNKMTEQELKEFWELCGFKEVISKEWWNHTRSKSTNYWWELPDGQRFKELPEPDLNNLFRWAIKPARIESIHFSYGDEGCLCWVYSRNVIGKPFYGQGENEPTALYQAIMEVTNGQKEVSK